MAKWRQLEREAPGVIGVGRDLWERHGIMYLATTRADGSPRVHPVVPVLADGTIFVAISEQSPKWRDLRRDPRCVLHALPGPRDDEFVLRCQAREAPGAVELVRSVTQHTIHNDDHIVELDIEEADAGWWENVGQPDTYSIRWRWTPGAGENPLPGLRAGHEQVPRHENG